MQLMQLWKQSFLDFLFIAAYTINVSWIINCDGLLYIVHAHYYYYFLLMIMHASLYVYQNNVFLFLMRLKFSSLFLRSFNFDKYI